MLRRLQGMSTERFIIYHADEVDEHSSAGVAALRSIAGVEVRSLGPWYNATYPLTPRVHNDTHDEPDISRLRSWFCKPAALLAAPTDVVALVDIDAVVLVPPFRLMLTREFARAGVYLFTDRRASGNYLHLNGFQNSMRELWATLHPDRPGRLPAELLQTPPFTRRSLHWGESAVLVFDKRKNAAAAHVLERLLSPELFETATQDIHGDKELYWMVRKQRVGPTQLAHCSSNPLPQHH